VDQKSQKHPDQPAAKPRPLSPDEPEKASLIGDAQHSTPRGSDVRMRLMIAAAEVFVRKGYSAASVNEIVEAAGVTKPVLYYYFQNKEGIFHAILGDASRDFMNLLQATRQDQSSVQTRINRLLESLYTLCEENIQIVRLMYALHYGPPQGTPEHDIEIFHRRVQEIIMELVQEGISTGELTDWDAQDIVWAILGIFDSAMELTLCHPEVGFNREKLARLLQILYLGLNPGNQHRQGERQ
jgi:TetR/AcrR family transcriptional regulator